ncbi:hypothetical protein P170DRAFT_423372 [Aspergillus steynii IBT 23096]|uniref:Fungal-type protein kinase domain-containing protein n=1 Tax=Aspergillus steynii IBT 23096 TaxID=1392250 RepID=A0A2I2GHZ5_9EURO|nr:uncharacterized protein P170DRAFT_423372 [Aspergillus steynii IBT 23096]PLB52505.1 hypothetical protein P170DRAFT_423372 [Aspergillus steynii IBT 23096]
MDASKIIYGRLSEIVIRPEPKTERSRRNWILSEDQVLDWPEFKREVRAITTKHLGEPQPQAALPPAQGHYVVGAEPGITSCIISGALEQVGQVLEAQGVRVRYGDRATGPRLIGTYYPDVIGQRSVEVGETRIAGEVKVPWNTSLEPGRDLHRVLGQVAKYMDTYGCSYGFACTYEKLVLVKRFDMFRFKVSPVVKGDQNADPETLSVRECFYFLARMAAGSEWKHHGDKAGDALTNGQFRSRNLRR